MVLWEKAYTHSNGGNVSKLVIMRKNKTHRISPQKINFCGLFYPRRNACNGQVKCRRSRTITTCACAYHPQTLAHYYYMRMYRPITCACAYPLHTHVLTTRRRSRTITTCACAYHPQTFAHYYYIRMYLLPADVRI